MSKPKPSLNKNLDYHLDNNVLSDNDDFYDHSCGMGSYRPKWLQVFASPTWFMVNFAIIGIIQNFTATYFIASMSTLEKRFAFDSKVSGFIIIADNFAQIILSPIAGYYAGRFNRARVIATGEMLIAGSCLLTALPYFIYGPATHLLYDSSLLSTNNRLTNETRYELCPANSDDITGECSTGQHSTVWLAVVLLWTGSVMRGFGFTAFYVVGVPYIDDSVGKTQSPIYLSLLTSLRLIGPAGGFLLSSLCLRFYENPFYDPGIERNNPRFIGAWWIGFVVIGLALSIVTLPMFLFPKELKKSLDTNQEANKKPKHNKRGLKGTIAALKRLVTNPFLVMHFMGSTIRWMGTGGFYLNKPKYIESHFRKSSSSASLLTGTTSIIPMAIGCMLGGAMITYLKPRPRTLVIFMFIVELFSNFGVFAGMFMVCPAIQLQPNLVPTVSGYTMNSGCNTGCQCTTRVFTPICSADNRTTYFSPCYAGCTNLDRTTNTLSGCSCISTNGRATTGYCPIDTDTCGNKLFAYILVLTIGNIVSSTAWTGDVLLTMRSVDDEDKSFAIGVTSTLMALFGFIPYPIIFGAVIDSACLVWESTCGKRGNCWLYDQDKFRYYLHGLAFTLMTVGSLFDLGMIFVSYRIKNFYDDDNPGENDQDKNNIPMNSLTIDTTSADSQLNQDNIII